VDGIALNAEGLLGEYLRFDGFLESSKVSPPLIITSSFLT